MHSGYFPHNFWLPHIELLATSHGILGFFPHDFWLSHTKLLATSYISPGYFTRNSTSHKILDISFRTPAYFPKNICLLPIKHWLLPINSVHFLQHSCLLPTKLLVTSCKTPGYFSQIPFTSYKTLVYEP